MNIKDFICESGGKILFERQINEDRVKFINNNIVILMDGASGLGKNNEIIKNKTSAEWFVDFILENLEKEIKNNLFCDVEQLVKKCVKIAKEYICEFERQNTIKLKEYEIPSASFTLLKDNGKSTEIFLLGDTITLLKYKDKEKIEVVNNINQEIVSNNNNNVLKRAKEIALKQNISIKEAMQAKEILEMLQNNRNKRNCDCDGGYYILSTDEDAIEHAIIINIDNSDIEGIILLTDGMDYKMLGLNENQVYDFIKNNGFKTLLNRIRKKQLQDSNYNESPRFKMSDDASGIFIENSVQFKLKKK